MSSHSSTADATPTAAPAVPWSSDRPVLSLPPLEGELGRRVRAVTEELGGEKIDIVDYDPELAKFVANALSPAKVTSSFILDASTKAVRALVPDYQLSLAIGKEGQNARLAAKLTGAKIDIQPDSVLES